MTLSEFKAWFEGYTEAIGDAPTKTQFDKIKAKVAALNGATLAGPAYPGGVRLGQFDFDNRGPFIGNVQVDRGSAIGNVQAAGNGK